MELRGVFVGVGIDSIILNISMNETYDVVVCGTGLIECILSGLLSQEGTFAARQGRRFCISTGTPTTEERAPQSTSPTSGRSSATRRSPTRNLDTIGTGTSTSSPSTSCTVENL
jgi:hypothetical protein